MSSIENNIVDPAASSGDMKIFGHFYSQHYIENKRSNEAGPLDPLEHKLLDFDSLHLSSPDTPFLMEELEKFSKFGDTWRDEFKSLRNLIHQLWSLHCVTKEALKWSPDIVVFARPDLTYHDNIKPYIRLAAKNRDIAMIPWWQHWGRGYNDRFAVVSGSRAIKAYGLRIDNADKFCKTLERSLHAELLLRFSLENNGIAPRLIRARASRTRSNGIVVSENFRHVKIERALRLVEKIRVTKK
ncbi:hypothetical protein [Sagittula sp. SSi028]|uniref:hypothetical protein n=1 Tax=Sagittula sp. SSi028 TaxID=3400636 RepID=UPI003AF93CB2